MEKIHREFRTIFQRISDPALNGFDQYENVRRMLPAGFDQYDMLNKSQWLESVIFMSSYLLSSQGDRVAMANSVEGRYPISGLQGSWNLRLNFLLISRCMD